MKRFIVTVAAACLGWLTAHAAEGRWQEYVYPEAGFSANFPDQPRSFSNLHPTSQAPSGGISERVYSFDEGGVVYSIGIVDFSHLAVDSDVVVGEAVTAIKAIGQLESETSLEIDLVHGTQYIVVSPDGTRYTAGIFYFRDQLYQVKVVYPVSNSDPAGSSGVGFFLAHFRFLHPF